MLPKGKGKKWVKLVLGIVAGLAILIGLILLWDKLEYFTPNPLIPHKKVVITLPYSRENEPISMIPMGETIEHNFYGGHPGIDFQWDYPVPLIAVADGRIISVFRTDDAGEQVYYVTLKAGGYLSIYKELDNIVPGIKKGLVVMRGDEIGYPHCVTRTESNGFRHTSCQLHWEFGYSMLSPGFERLCPLTYFDVSALSRINKLWASVPANDQFKQKFPNICNNIYFNRDQ